MKINNLYLYSAPDTFLGPAFIKAKELVFSEKIGEIMMNALKDVDQVAYVRFASVYRDFQDISDFSDEIKSLSKEDKKKSKKK